MAIILYIMVFFSGFSALIYQLMWQRMLFLIFGIDLVSISIIVSVFMFGLGIGGLCGGFIADRFNKQLIFLYVLTEMGIGLFGIASPTIIHWLGTVLLSANHFTTAVSCFLLLLFPTFLMGATFPVLVTYLNQSVNNVGQSVGSLYWFNTLGGAIAAASVSYILLTYLDINQATYLAALLNGCTALIALSFYYSDPST